MWFLRATTQFSTTQRKVSTKALNNNYVKSTKGTNMTSYPSIQRSAEFRLPMNTERLV